MKKLRKKEGEENDEEDKKGEEEEKEDLKAEEGEKDEEDEKEEEKEEEKKNKKKEKGKNKNTTLRQTFPKYQAAFKKGRHKIFEEALKLRKEEDKKVNRISYFEGKWIFFPQHLNSQGFTYLLRLY